MSEANRDERLIEKIKNKNVGKTSYGNHTYSNLWFVCHDNKICITFTPRGGCSISMLQYLDLVGLLEDALHYNSFVHLYRCKIFQNNIPYCKIDKLKSENYTFVKFIINPYIRAVTIFRWQTSHNLSFREYLKQLTNNKTEYFNNDDKYHYEQQYIEGEENYITKYIKINENEKYTIILNDGKPYELDANKYTSCHHGVKNQQNTKFCGDLESKIVNNDLPKSYKYFYDDDIKKMVETFYKDDIEKYGFSFDDF